MTAAHRSIRTLARLASLAAALLATAPCARADALHDHPGYWLGEVTYPNKRAITLGVELYLRADGSAWAGPALPAEGKVDFPVKAVRAESDDSFVIEANDMTMKLTWAGDHFDADWKQGYSTVRVALRHVVGFPEPARAQAPHAPYPYRDETLAIRSNGGVALGATLSIPAGAARPNAVVLVAGGGLASRHGGVDGHRRLDVLADHLARQGVAVLRYDTRGIGRSSGDFSALTPADLADDAQAAAQALAAQGRFARIGLLGEGPGADVAAVVAARQPDRIGFVVSLGGQGLSGRDWLLQLGRELARSNGATPAELDRIAAFDRRYYDAARAAPRGKWGAYVPDDLFTTLAPDDRRLIAMYRIDAGMMVPGRRIDPGTLAMLASDPPADWRKVRCPVLVLHGALDVPMPARPNIDGIVAALKDGGNTRVDAAVLPGLNALFQTARTGAPGEYTTLDEAIAPAALQKVAAFARAR